MATLLEVLNAIIDEYAIAGGTPVTTFANLEPELSRMVDQIIAADAEIQGAWNDWSFMRATAASTVTAATDVIPLPDLLVQGLVAGDIANVSVPDYPFKEIDIETMVVRPATTSASPLGFIEWRVFRRMYEIRPKSAQTNPSAWSIKPDRTLVLSDLAPVGDLVVQYDYYLMPRAIPRHIDAVPRTPACVVNPTSQSQLHVPRALVALGTMKWAAAETRFDILTSATQLYQTEMEMLRSTYGELQSAHLRMGADPLIIRVN